jgi:chromosome segregation ATPase
MAAQPEVAEVNEIEARLARVSKQLDSNRKSKQADEEAVANMEGKKLEMQNQLDDVKVACEELERDLREAQEERKWLFDRYSRIVVEWRGGLPQGQGGRRLHRR